MRIGWAAQGPGPITLAYRTSLLLRHQHTAQTRRAAPPRKSVRPDRGFGLRQDAPTRVSVQPGSRSTVDATTGHFDPRHLRTRRSLEVRHAKIGSPSTAGQTDQQPSGASSARSGEFVKQRETRQGRSSGDLVAAEGVRKDVARETDSKGVSIKSAKLERKRDKLRQAVNSGVLDDSVRPKAITGGMAHIRLEGTKKPVRNKEMGKGSRTKSEKPDMEKLGLRQNGAGNDPIIGAKEDIVSSKIGDLADAELEEIGTFATPTSTTAGNGVEAGNRAVGELDVEEDGSDATRNEAGPKQDKSERKRRGPGVRRLDFNFDDTREDRLPVSHAPPASGPRETPSRPDGQASAASTDNESHRMVDDSGNLIGVDESSRRTRLNFSPTRHIAMSVSAAALDRDLYSDLPSSNPHLSAFSTTTSPIPYTRSSTSKLDLLDLSERHRQLLRSRHHDQAVPLDEYMPIFASAPPEHRQYAPHLANFRDAIRNEDLPRLIDSYSKLCDWRATDQFVAADWRDAALLIGVSIRSEHAAKNVDSMLREQPVVYGALSEMAVESAVRDHWDGLYRLMLALIRIGNPMRAKILYERYRHRLLQHQGRNAADLINWDRAARIAARVEGEGVKPLSTVNLAALAMLDDVSGATIRPMFGSRTNWRTFDKDTVQEVISVLRTVRRSDANALVRGFNDATSNFMLAILCHHPNALRERLRELYTSNNWAIFDQLYRQVLAGSIGPHKIIRPLDLDSEGQGKMDTDVVMTNGVWYSFIDGFTHFGRPEELWNLVNDVFSTRQLHIPAAMIGRVALSFAWIAMNVSLSEETRRVAREYGDLLHRRAVAMGYAHVDAYLAPRLEIHYTMKNYSAVDAEYDRLRAQGVNIGPKTRTSLVHIYASLDPTRALQVLGWTLGDPKIAEPESPYPYRRFVSSMLRARPMFPYKRVVEVLRNRPKGCVLPPRTRALLATMMVHQNNALKFDDYVNALIDCAGTTVDERLKVVQAVVTRGFPAPHTTTLEARAALELLRDYITHQANIQYQSRVERIWGLYLRSVIRSKLLTTSQRSTFVRQAVGLLENKYRSLGRVLAFNIVGWTLSRRHRPTSLARPSGVGHTSGAGPVDAIASIASDEDAAEAVYWWNRLRGIDTEQAGDLDPTRNEEGVSAYWWLRMMYALKNSGRLREAASLVADAWDGNSLADESQGLSEFRVSPVRSVFWDAALGAGLVKAVGLSESDLVEARRAWLGTGTEGNEERDEEEGRDGRVVEEEESLDDEEARLEREAVEDDD